MDVDMKNKEDLDDKLNGRDRDRRDRSRDRRDRDRDRSRERDRDERARRDIARRRNDHWEPERRAKRRSRSRSRSPRRRSVSRRQSRRYSRSYSRSRSRSRDRDRKLDQFARSLGGPINADPDEALEMSKHSKRENRVYVGNLSYDVRYRDLMEFMRGGGFGEFHVDCCRAVVFGFLRCDGVRCVSGFGIGGYAGRRLCMEKASVLMIGGCG